MLFVRTILKSVIQSVDEYPVTLVTGARQVGKSTLVSYFEKNMNYEYISFDDEILLNEALEDPRDFLDNHPTPLIIDEVQKAKIIFKEIERRVNEVRRKKGTEKANGMYILTGSQKFNLMQEVSESMSGRVGIIEMNPLSMCEIKGWKNETFEVDNNKLIQKSDTRELTENELYEAVVRGFYPARWEIKNKPIKNYYANYIKTYIEKDVSQLISLKDKTRFENLLKVLSYLTAEEYIPSNIANTVGVDVKTIESWVNILVTGDIIRLLEPYYENSINKRIVKRKKLFFNDTGLACYLLGIDSVNTFKLSSFKGKLIETYINNEIYKSYKNENENANMYFYRDNNQNEVDLIILKDGKLNLIECKSGKNYSLEDIKGFKQLEKTKYDIAGRCIICTTNEIYKIGPSIFAHQIKCL